MKKITIIAGARPNFMKIAPIIHEILRVQGLGQKLEYRLIHTGQHYDSKMSGDFFNDLNIPAPNLNLESGGGSQSEQTGSIMVNFEKELLNFPADLVLVVGDVTSTMACAIVAQKLHTKVAHVEAGIRSNDWSMPEEINRLVTDSITNYFFTTSEIANENLKKSGVSSDKIFFVGNTMIDTLVKFRPVFKKPTLWDELNLVEKNFVIITLHRPANVDEESSLKELLNEIIKCTGEMQLIFPVHPRTAQILKNLGVKDERMHFTEPMGYLEFNYLVERAKIVITDSGGITEETTVMGVPCMTLRDSTERPETVTQGTNLLIGTNPRAIKPAMDILMSGNWKKGSIPKLWDGRTASRIVETILSLEF
ncbi:MAG: non-hydrolyzing UDP-N-acetylglucosamine 2-epimerase [Flavobacteriia bacterium]|jgi:UDP-N-acetylglucosamine 2-epimerase (non-hydrolysing)